MKKKRIYFSTELLGSLCLILLIFSSCAKVFIPNNHHHLVSPTHKDSLKWAGHIYDTYKDGDESAFPSPLRRYAYGAQLGYSPIEGLGLIANYYHPSYTEFVVGNAPDGVSTTTTTTTSFENNRQRIASVYTGYLSDLAIGKYWKLSTPSASRKGLAKALLNNEEEWLFDLYGGIGKGNISGDYAFRGSRSFSFNEYYLQGGVHLIWINGYSSVDLVTRLTGTNFGSINFLGNIFEDDVEVAERLINKSLNFSSRTSLRVNIGPDYAKAHVEVNWLKTPKSAERFYFNDQQINVGLVLNLDDCYGRLKKLKKKDK